MRRKSLFFITILLSVTDFMAQPGVTIRRTAYGVPHILADNLFGAAKGLAYAQMEDYGEAVVLPVIRAQGKLGLLEGIEGIDSDVFFVQSYEAARYKYDMLSDDTKALLEGFADGINTYLEEHATMFPQFTNFSFHGVDIAAVSTWSTQIGRGERILDLIRARLAAQDSMRADQESGSNTWAFGPERTQSGHAVLMRNPHLSWSAGYYEAHITVPGQLNFYGDFRIGGLFNIIGGFNNRLGWSTTNNYPDLDELYALSVDTSQPDHYLLDGESHPIDRRVITVDFKNGNGIGQHREEVLTTPFGPVVSREHGFIYVLKRAGDKDIRRSEQFTRMMLAQNLDEWKEAMRLQAITQSNYTYADADGNIFYVWNGMIPDFPKPNGGDSTAVPVSSSAEIWQDLMPFDALPILHNPPGGYLHNENDPFHCTNLNQILHPDSFPIFFRQPRLRARSQHSLSLIHNDHQYTLEEIVALKHSTLMYVGVQLLDPLLQAIRSAELTDTLQQAAQFLETWDQTVDAKSQGGVLFAEWFYKYRRLCQEDPIYEIPWSLDDPMNTPRGLYNDSLAIIAFRQAVEKVNAEYGTYKIAWGDVYRIRHGQYDLPASGGPGTLGCFRVLGFTDTKDGKKEVYRGDGWQFAVEFSDPPRAYSILAYGQSNDPESPHHDDQVELFSENKMKPVAFTEEDIRQSLIQSYKVP